MMHVTFYYFDGMCGEIKSVREVNHVPVIGDTVYFSLDVDSDEKCLKGKFVVSGREFWFERGGLKTTIILTRK